MSVEQAATADTTLAGAPAKRREMRILGPLAVGLALLLIGTLVQRCRRLSEMTSHMNVEEIPVTPT